MNIQPNTLGKSTINQIYMVIFAFAALLITQFAFAADKDPKIAWDKIDNGALIVDVRTAEEFAAGHLKNAINVPFEEIATEFKQRAIAKDTNIVLYCRSGRRSGIAFDSLVTEGYTNGYNGGGFETLSQFKQGQ